MWLKITQREKVNVDENIFNVKSELMDLLYTFLYKFKKHIKLNDR